MLLKAVITAFPWVSLPFFAVPLPSQPPVAIRVLLAAAPETAGFRDADESTPLLCLLKRNDTSLNTGGQVTCQRGHPLAADPRRLNYCDVCRTTGTKYRCGMGCDYDMCEKCFASKAAKSKKSSKQPPPPNSVQRADVEMIRQLVAVCPEVVVAKDRAGKLPVQVAEELGLASEVRALLLEATRASGQIWCGAPNDSPQPIEVHLLAHILGGSSSSPTAADAEAKQVRFDNTFVGMSTNEQACRATRYSLLAMQTAATLPPVPSTLLLEHPPPRSDRSSVVLCSSLPRSLPPARCLRCLPACQG
eukprot:SAG22_NODE_563_length_9067_cov_5.039251_7_plen_304_part_00